MAVWESRNMGAPKKPYRLKAQEQEFLAMLRFSQSNPKPEKSSQAFSTCKTSCPRAPAQRYSCPQWSWSSNIRKQTHEACLSKRIHRPKKKLPWTTKAVSTYYMAKEKYPPLLSYGLQVGAACVVGAAASVRRGANIIDMATKHTYTHSLSSDLQGEKNRNKAKRSRLKTQTKKKKKKNHAECAIRCECTWGDE